MEWKYNTTGIPDEMFYRGEVPITKSEIRALSLSKLKLFSDCKLLDVGCGTGSITVEAGILCYEGEVIAIDKNQEAVSLTEKNIEKFHLKNAKAFLMDASIELPDKTFHRVFIGGGGKELDHIIKSSKDILSKDGIIVMNTILIESTYNALNALEKYGYKNIECISVNIAVGHNIAGWMMKALNPIYIIKAEVQCG